MILRSFILSACLFFLTQFLIAQSDNHELGKVTIEELQKPFSSIDSSAVAEYLFLKGSYALKFDERELPYFENITETRIKIYKKEGYNYATFTFPVRNEGKIAHNPISEAYTYNLADGNIEVTKLESEGEFVQQINKNYSLRKYTMPNVREGSIIEFKFTSTKSGVPGIMPEWYFQKSIPTVFNQLIVTAHPFYAYRTVLKPYHEINRTDETIGEKKKKVNKTVYTATQINAIENEPFVSTMDNYIASVQYELAAEGMKDLSVEWNDVTKTIFELFYNDELAIKGFFEKDLNAYFKQNDVRPQEKLMAVFTFVKEKMKWNQNNGIFPEFGIANAYKNKIGNVADINLMLIVMLRDIGIYAHPVLLSTRSNGIPLFPSRRAFNYVIAAAKLPDGGYYLLDATNKYALPQILPLRCLNGTGRMIAEKGYSHEVDLMPVRPSKSSVTVLANISSDGVVSGKMRDQMTDYYASNYRENFNDLTKQSMIEKVQNQYKSLEILDHKILNKTELSDPFIEEYEFVNHTSVEIIAGKMYIFPTLHYGFRFNPFKAEKRNFPVDFTFPKNDKYLISLKIPEGYAVESLPEPLISTLGENSMIFKYQVSLVNTTIQVSMSIDYNQTIVEPENYESLKAFFGKMAEKQSEQIVLKRL